MGTFGFESSIITKADPRWPKRGKKPDMSKPVVGWSCMPDYVAIKNYINKTELLNTIDKDRLTGIKT